MIAVSFGPGGAIIGVLPFTQSMFGVDVTEATDEFGYSVAVGDLNGDGFGDAIVGSPGEIRGGLADGGQVSVIPGGPGGLGTGPAASFWSQNTGGILEVLEVGDRMGQDVSSGDFNGDGFDDLLATASGESLGAALDLGIVHAIYGSAAGLTAAGDQLWHQNKAGVPGVNATLDGIGVLGR